MLIIIPILLLIGGLVFLYSKNIKLKDQIDNHRQNQEGLKDSLKVSKNKIGELVYSKAIFVAETNELGDYNIELEKEVKKLKGDVLQLTKIKFEYDKLNQFSENDKVVNYGNNVYGIEWEFIKEYNKENKRIINGLTKFKYDPLTFSIIPLNTTLVRDFFNFSIVTGLSKENGIIETFGTISYPELIITDISGFQKPKTKGFMNKIKLGVYSGYGLTYSTQNNQFYHGFQTGAGLMYHF